MGISGDRLRIVKTAGFNITSGGTSSLVGRYVNGTVAGYGVRPTRRGVITDVRCTNSGNALFPVGVLCRYIVTQSLVLWLLFWVSLFPWLCGGLGVQIVYYLWRFAMVVGCNMIAGNNMVTRWL